MHTITLICSNAGGLCLRKATQLHLPPRRLPAQPFPESWGQEQVADVGGSTCVSIMLSRETSTSGWMERTDVFIGGLLYSEALHREREALLCHVLVAAAVCFHLFNIVVQEGIQCVGRILQQLSSVTSYVQIAPAFWLQAMGGAAPSSGTGTDQPLRLQC